MTPSAISVPSVADASSAPGSRSPVHGTREWSDASVNCTQGCPNGCLYCYARDVALHYRRIRTAAEWTTPRPLAPIAAGKYPSKKFEGVVMFPTTHDITTANLADCLKTLVCLLAAGNRVLIVTKASMHCMKAMMPILREHRPQVELRVTIGCLSEQLAAFWEPGAPTICERLACLKFAFGEDLHTSVSAEPLLDPPNAVRLLETVDPFVTGTVWFGKLNEMTRRLAWLPPQGERAGIIARLAELQEDAAVMETVRCLSATCTTKIRWKDSYREVIERCGNHECHESTDE